MHDAHVLIPTLTTGLAAALILGYITHRVGLSPIVGYLLAGIAVGQYTPGFVADIDLAQQLAEVGVILLMFGVGLQFHFKELLAVRRVAIPGAIVQSTVATVLGVIVAVEFGWSISAGLVFGLSISVASTVVLMRVLSDNRDLHTSTGHIAVGWLVVEDLFTVVVLVLLPALFGKEASPDEIPIVLGTALLKVAFLVAVVFVVGGRVIPALLVKMAASRSRELFTLTVLVVALGIAVGSSSLFGVSMELGAFLAGMVVGRSEFSFRAASEAIPMRDAFAVLFFVSVGMLLDPAGIAQAPGLLAATVAVILIGKPLAAFAIVTLLGYPLRTVLGVTVALAQIGEFSFILANLGANLNLLSEQATNTLIAAAIISISLNPLLYRMIGPVENWLMRSRGIRQWNDRREGHSGPEGAISESAAAEEMRDRAVVVGCGPVGMTVARLLRENGVEPTMIDMNLDTVQRLRARGERAVYGDATRRDTLLGARLAEARALILSAPNVPGTPEIIRLAREINPSVRVLARSTYVSQGESLRTVGADAVFSEEGEIALAFTQAVLEALGATPEQIDRERERVHEELFGKSEKPRTEIKAQEKEKLATGM